METRLAIANDLPLLAALHAASFDEAPWSEAQIAGSLAASSAWALLVYDGAVACGFILCQQVLDEAEILTFCVVPAARRKGLGRALLRAAWARVREASGVRMFLEVAGDNVAARALYQKEGFRITGIRADYYKRQKGAVDALTMAFDLTSPF